MDGSQRMGPGGSGELNRLRPSDGAAALEELRWLERLAYRLVHDRELARDLSQEALLAAERGGTGPQRRPWLVRTVRNLASKALRSKGRRGRREQVAARPEALPSASELAERAEVQRELLRLVGNLPDRYRTVLLLRYYDGAAPRHIAERLGVPVRTVHTRLARGLALLREHMDRDHPGGRASWVGALAVGWSVPAPAGPAPHAGPAAPSALGLTLVAAPVLAVPVLAVLVFALAVRPARLFGPGDATAATAPVPIEAAAALEATRSIAAEPIASDGRAPQTPASASLVEAPEVQAPAAAVSTGIRVVDWEGRAVPGAIVDVVELTGVRMPLAEWRALEVIEGAERPGGATDADGFVRLPLSERLLVRAGAPGLVCAYSASVDPERLLDAGEPGPVRPCVVLAPAVRFERTVADEFGRPLSDAEVEVTLDERAQARFALPLGSAHSESWSARTDALGRFAIEGLPGVDAARVTVFRPDLGRASWPLLEAPATLVFEAPAHGRAVGRVVDPRGRGLGGAVVDSGVARAITAADGRFELAAGEDGALWVALGGWAPTRFERSAVEAGPLVLREPAAHLAGRVVDGAGQPVAGIAVWLEDATVVGEQRDPLELEAVAVGLGGEVRRILTNRAGRFRIGGLRPDRTYRVRALDQATAAWVESAPFQSVTNAELAAVAGAGPRELELVLDRSELRTVEGRLVDSNGRPLAGATVVVQGPGYRVASSTTYAHGERATTDAEGRYALSSVPVTGSWLRAEHPTTMLSTCPLDELEAVWRLPLAARLQVELLDASPGVVGDVELELRDASGRALRVWFPRGLGRSESTRFRASGGRTPLLEVPCDAVELVVLRAGRAVRRAPLDLPPGSTRFVRL